MSDALFTIKSTGPMRRDCTQPFDVVFSYNNLHPTVKEFVNYVISNDQEWGEICIAPDAQHANPWSIIGHRIPHGSIDYKWGEVLESIGTNYPEFLEKYGSATIVSAKADGGWSRMDYVLLLN